MHRLVVATCITSGVLFSLGLPAGHFTHVLVDEAGQATEPECLIPMGANSQSDGVTVLAGDPFQLGPVLSSRWALRYGLQRSYLERLLLSSTYCRDESGFHPHLATKLVRNYRAHAAILEPYSQLFYDSELQPHAAAELSDRLLTWPGFPSNNFPLTFIGIRGSELRDPNSPSFFNPAEVVEVVRAAGRLLAFGLASCDVGIITPYRKQVEKIRELLASTSGADLIKVGSVEEFQGQERAAIVVSTVRSDEGEGGVRLDHTLGFLANPKRFNVTISRAQAGLVIVGNPFVLCNDPQWLHFLRYVLVNGSYRGCDLEPIGHILKVEINASSSEMEERFVG